VIRIKNSYPRFLLKLSLAGVLLKEPPLSVGANQFSGWSCTRWSPAAFTAHHYANRPDFSLDGALSRTTLGPEVPSMVRECRISTVSHPRRSRSDISRVH
jgi:hypothetical protein